MTTDIVSPGWAQRLKDEDKLRLVKVYQIIARWERAVTRYEGQDTEFLQEIAEVLK